MAQIFVNLIGHNASGKSTIAKRLEQELQVNRISGDDFREFLASHILYFQKTGFSYPSDKTKVLHPVVFSYRTELAYALLAAGQSVLYEGSGATREIRQKYLAKIRRN